MRVGCGANVVISGGAISCTTALLRVLASFSPGRQRRVTIEEAAELQLGKPNVVGLEARPPNVEGRGEVTVRDLVRNALRMRPDRIIVGEVRGGEALDMLQAMNTGHEGSLSTAHANSPRHLLWRLETMALMSDVDLPLVHLREQIASAVDIVVHMARLPDGRRVAFQVASVDGMHEGRPLVNDIFFFRPRAGRAGRFEASGAIPRVVGLLRARGEDVPDELFAPGTQEAQGP